MPTNSRFGRKHSQLAAAIAITTMAAPHPAYAQLIIPLPSAIYTDTATSDTQDPIGDALAPLTQPLGSVTAPIVESVDVALDPLTDPIDQQLLAPVIEAAEPLTGPTVDALSPILTPVDSITTDLTGGGNISDTLTTSNDRNPDDGDGVANDALYGDAPSNSAPTSDSTPLAPITEPVGEVLQPVVDTVDSALDPVTDPVDEQVLAPVLDALTPVTDPVTDALAPVLDPVDEIVNDLTGGSTNDALSNGDGQGLIGDALGSGNNGNRGNGNNGNGRGNTPLAPITEPVGEVLQPVVEEVDNALNPVTDPVDEQVLAPVLDALTPVTDPVTDALAPVLDPVDEIVNDLTGGSTNDALSNGDGQGLIGDALGSGNNGNRGNGNNGNGRGNTPLAPITEPVGEVLQPVVEEVDNALNPVTDPVDEQVLAPVLDALTPVTDPVTDALAPVLDPVDEIVNDLTGGSTNDALSNGDGQGLIGDALGSGNNGNRGNGNNGNGRGNTPLAPITEPVGEVLQPVVEEVDNALNPVTDPVDEQVLAPVLDALTPVTDPVTDALAPVLDPVDEIVNDLTGGSTNDALSNGDGQGLIGDALGSGNNGNRGNGNNGNGRGNTPLAPITEPVGDVLQPVVEEVDNALNPVTDPVDEQVLAPVLDALTPVTDPVTDALAPVLDPVDEIVNDLTGGSTNDALSNNDGEGLLGDALGSGDAPANGNAGDSSNPLAPITEPVGDVLQPVVEEVDNALNPVTDPVTDALAPVLDPVDEIVNDLTGGSTNDALSNNDGEGLLGDTLGSGDAPADGGTGDSSNPLAPITEPVGDVLQPVVEEVDNALNPVTDPVDEQVLAPVLDALTPVTDPVTDALAPVLDPVDEIVNDLTGGSTNDALSNNDGEGLLGDTLGSGDAPADGGTGDSSNPLAPITEPVGDVLQPVVDTVDSALDPVTDPVDDAATPILDTLAPVVDPATGSLITVVDPVDGIVNDLTDGSASDALTNEDANPSDGNGLANDLLGGEVINGDQDSLNRINNNPGLLALIDEDGLYSGQCNDADADGICDSRDSCKDSPANALVLPNGCHLDELAPLTLEGVFFEFNQARLTDKSIDTLNAAIDIIQASQAAKLELAGHTDNKGSATYNEELSKQRAAAVKAYFVERGIDPERLIVRGYGKNQPIASNDSAESRAQNRRVELKVVN